MVKIALILEKVIEYEAVHEISSWKDLRERLEPHDRLCFLFHPSMQDEPLIFVVVALMDKGYVEKLMMFFLRIEKF